MKVQTSTLVYLALDWATAMAEGYLIGGHLQDKDTPLVQVQGCELLMAEYDDHGTRIQWAPSTDWSQADPIIERAGVHVRRGNDLHFPKGNERGDFTEPLWLASIGSGQRSHGPSYLISAMRCIVATRLGPEVDVPDLLMEQIKPDQIPSEIPQSPRLRGG